MFFSWRGVLLGLLIVLCLYLAGYAKHFSSFVSQPDRFHVALLDVEKCGKGTNPTQCSQVAVRQLLADKSGAEVMNALSTALSPQACHYVGHVVGQQMYKKYQNVEEAISKCNRVCDSPCIHGIIGEAFAETLGFNSAETKDLDLEHLSPSDILAAGSKLCSSPGTCHGVGHALFQTYQKFEPAFAMCKKVAGIQVNECYNGVTMEYADAISSRGMSIVSNVSLPDPKSLDTLCDLSTAQESRACYRYFPRMAIATLAKQAVSKTNSLQKVKDICKSKSTFGLREACFGGIGSYWSYLILTDTKGAVASCQDLGSQQAEASCIVGKLGIATEDRSVPLAAYCSEMTNETMKGICYQGLFYFLNRVGFSQQRAAALCESADTVCQQALKENKTTPLKKIEALSAMS